METGILKSVSGGDGGRSSMVEPQIVVLVVAGSSPVGHPESVLTLLSNSNDLVADLARNPTN